MRTIGSADALVSEAKPVKAYGSSVLRAARHRHYIAEEARATDVADEIRGLSLAAACVVDAEKRPVGVLRRDRLFSLVGKPFGREVLGRTPVRELAEPALVHDAQAGIFGVAAEMLGAEEEATEEEYRVLVDGEGRFVALVSSRDLAAYLSRMTRDDIELAGKLQERLLAGNESLSGESWAIEPWSRPAMGVGGDFYFTRRLPGGGAFLALCDVSGKGVAASLVVSMVWGMLAMCDFERGLRSLVRSLNSVVVASFHLEKYLTGFFAVLDPAQGRLLAADMGHSHVLLFRDGKVLSPKGGGLNLPIGVEQEIEPTISSWNLLEGDRLLVFTDGITEQEDEEGEEFGLRRLSSASLRAFARGERLSSLLPAVIDGFRGGIPQQDDMSFLVLSMGSEPS